MLRSLTELEIALQSVAANLRAVYEDAPSDFVVRPGIPKDRYHIEVSRAANALSVAAASLYLPDGEVLVKVVVPRSDMPFPSEGQLVMPLRAAVLMYKDWIWVGENFRQPPGTPRRPVFVDSRLGWVHERLLLNGKYVTGGGSEIDKRAIPAWQIWLASHEVHSTEIPYPLPPRYLEALQFEVEGIVHATYNVIPT